MKTLICTVLLVAVGAVNGANAQGAAGAEEGRIEMPGANWLFVQTADSITTDGKTITLKGVNPQTLMFTDRPERMTGDASTEKFVAFWKSGQSDFEKDPPNATISTVVDGKPELAVVELTNPQLSGDSLTYTIKVLGMEPPNAGQAVSLFIDWWYGPRWGWRGWAGGYCWRGPWGGLHCRPRWAW
jgi:hypothetical protein